MEHTKDLQTKLSDLEKALANKKFDKDTTVMQLKRSKDSQNVLSIKINELLKELALKESKLNEAKPSQESYRKQLTELKAECRAKS